MRKQLLSKTIIAATFIVVAVAAALYFLPKFFPSNNGTTHTYMNDVYGVAFDYPSRYDLTEASKQDGNAPELIVTLTDKKWLPAIDGEGPTAITLEIYKGDESVRAREDAVETWIRSATSSNFHLSTNGTLGETRIANQSGQLYTWSGLYEGTSIATEHRGNILLFTVTYDGNNDMQKRQDFTILMESVRFYSAIPEAATTSVLR